MLKTNKALGQNFLKDENILERIAGLLEPDLPVVEIGAGLGYLTRVLAQNYQVIAIEKDERFEADLGAIKNVELNLGDVMDLDLEKILPVKYQVAGNLPYNLSKKIIHLFFKLKNPPQKMVFLIQKEVGNELCQANFTFPLESLTKSRTSISNKKREVGERMKLTLFSLSVKFYCHPACGFIVKKGSFNPMPKVDGRVIVLDDIGYPLPFGLNREQIEKDFFQLLHFGFSSPRKKLLNNLTAGLSLDKISLQKILIRAKIEEGKRAEDVPLESWLKLFTLLNNPVIKDL
jgi:16S rRNA (adenine1518-N6/adenine1519-N6)-dimethyltransferase